MNTYVTLSSLSMDLKRVAMGYHRGSNKMAKRFSEEALARKKEIEDAHLKTYVKRLLNHLESLLSQKDREKLAEDALMYSTLFQNASVTIRNE